MKKVYVLIILLVSVVSAQEQWGDPEFIWTDPGGTIYRWEPCFSPDSTEILLASPFDPEGGFTPYRIMRLDIEYAFWPEDYLADSLSVENYDDISPFITSDGDQLYFASNRPGGYGGFDIWMTEKANGQWTMPVNLGNQINTQEDETGPSVTSDGTTIYLFRGTYDLYDLLAHGHIHKSSYVDGQWQTAEPLPAPIYSEYSEYKPSISATGEKLYFISNRPSDLPGPGVWLSYRDGQEWSEPALLSGHVNYYEEVCDGWITVGHPTSAVISLDGLRLLYVKLDIFDCFCPESDIFIAHLTTDLNENEAIVPQALSLSLYPNPFNSSLSINANNSGPAEIEIFDLLGRSVVSFELHEGHNTVTWDGRNRFGNDCPSGIYFVRLSSGGRSVSRSAVMLK